ncbi:MAG: hypothetical protein PHV68_03420, partial [Candidatus Gastranaerophilales bacterium]|nr:hypothetical protein [Candidatus Gastranaerophilales bacterium]
LRVKDLNPKETKNACQDVFDIAKEISNSKEVPSIKILLKENADKERGEILKALQANNLDSLSDETLKSIEVVELKLQDRVMHMHEHVNDVVIDVQPREIINKQDIVETFFVKMRNLFFAEEV